MPPLTDIELRITLNIVDRFLKAKEARPYNYLVHEFKNPGAIEHLSRIRILSATSNNNRPEYTPTALAFQYCGDSDFLRMAKEAVTAVLRVLLQTKPV